MGGNILERKTLGKKHLVVFVVTAGLVFGASGLVLINKNRTEAGRSLPILILDDQKRIPGRREGQTPEEIVKANNITLFPEDVVTKELILDPVNDGAAGEKIVIKRAPVFRVAVDDGEVVIRSWAETISGVLDGKIQLGAKDQVTPKLTAVATPGYIVVTRITVIETDETVLVPFSTVEKADFFTPQGSRIVATKGVNGSKIRHLRIRYKNGVEENRVVLSESISKAPVTEVVKKGQMPTSSRGFNRTYWNWMVEAGSKYAVSPLDLFEVAACESRVNPNSVNGAGYYGMFQYNLGFWKTASGLAGFSGAPWSDAKAQIFTTAKWVSANGWGRWGCKP